MVPGIAARWARNAALNFFLNSGDNAMMSGPDIYPVADTYYMPYDDQPYYGLPYDPWYGFSIDELIRQGAQTAQIIGAGYPPGSTNVYAPQYPAQQSSPYPMPLPTPTPATALGQAQSSGGVQLSTTTLMLLVGGFLLFTLGKRGR
jgi:hypothetical protein